MYTNKRTNMTDDITSSIEAKKHKKSWQRQTGRRAGDWVESFSVAEQSQDCRRCRVHFHTCQHRTTTAVQSHGENLRLQRCRNAINQPILSAQPAPRAAKIDTLWSTGLQHAQPCLQLAYTTFWFHRYLSEPVLPLTSKVSRTYFSILASARIVSVISNGHRGYGLRLFYTLVCFALLLAKALWRVCKRTTNNTSAEALFSRG